MVFVWIIPLLGVAVGSVLMHDAIRYSTTAPEQAAGAALALCCAVLPYVVARAIEGIVLTSWRANVLAALKMTRANAAALGGNSEAATPADAQKMKALTLNVPAFGICPDCGRRRSTASMKCMYCGDTAPVKIDE